MRRIIHKHRHINAQSNHFMQSVCIAARIHWPQIDSRLYEWSFPAFVCESPHFCPVRTVTHSVHSSLFLGAAFRLHCNSQSVCYKMRACAVCCCIGAVSLGTLIEKWMVSSYSLCESPKKKTYFVCISYNNRDWMEYDKYIWFYWTHRAILNAFCYGLVVAQMFSSVFDLLVHSLHSFYGFFVWFQI